MSTIQAWVDITEEMVSPLFVTEWGKRSSIAALVLAIALLLYTAFSVFNDWRSIGALFYAPSSAASASPGGEMVQMIAQIPDQHLFGKFGIVDKSAVLPLTSLQLQLTGIIRANPVNLSRVIISEGGKPGKIYQVGDTLDSGVSVYAITEDGVILENGGQLEKLLLREPNAAKKVEASPPVEDNNVDDEPLPKE